MIRLTWRQFRTQAAVALTALVTLAIVLAITGPRLAHSYDTSGIATCKKHHDCAALTAAFLNYAHNVFFGLLGLLGPALLAVPALLGIFWAAPLVARELETGTYRLAWTQTVTRTRWFAVKVALTGLASIAVAGLLSLMITWWSNPIDRVTADQFRAGLFDERGIVAVGYAAFAFALGLTAGTIIRRTLPAMAATLVPFVAGRLAMTYWLRRRLIPPAHTSLSVSSELGQTSHVGLDVHRGPTGSIQVTISSGNPPKIPNAWVYSARVVDKTGHPPTSQSLHDSLLRACPTVGARALRTASQPRPTHGSSLAHAHGGASALNTCVTKVLSQLHEAVTYQPASRYWTFQGYETAIFLAAALALTGFSLWWIRHRLT